MRVLPLIIGLALAGNALHLPQDQPSEWRPVREVTTAPTIEEFELGSFSFQLPGIYHLRAHYGSIEGEPTIGVRYGVEASIGGERYIASATFELLDAQGNVVQEIPMALEHTGVASSFRFFGLLTVPAHPFRVQMRTVGVDGRRFRATYLRRFEPVRTPPEPAIPRDLGLPFDLTQAYQKMLREAEAEREAKVAARTAGPIVMPTVRVSNVRYAPYRSARGQVLGIRLSYEVEFDTAGRYSPDARVFLDYPDSVTTRRYDFRVLNLGVSPAPHLAHAPHQTETFTPGIPPYSSDYIYRAGTRYTFTTDLVPAFMDYVGLERTRCISESSYSKGDFARILAAGGPERYKVLINHDTYEGVIDAFDSEGVLYQNWLNEGARPCNSR